MITLLLFLSVMCTVHGQIVPLLYAVPSAVSHQSRIDIRHSPGFITGPLVYSPGTTLHTSHQPNDKPQETLVTPIFTADTIFTPVALSFFHNLPLARALEHPISIDKVQEENAQNESFTIFDDDTQNTIITETPEQEITTEEKPAMEDKNYIIIAYDNNRVTSTTDVPKVGDITEP